jgi:hypothetical protein
VAIVDAPLMPVGGVADERAVSGLLTLWRTMPRMCARVLVVICAVLGALAVAAPAHAAADPTSVTISAGTLQYTTPLTASDFPSVTLSGAQRVVTTDVNPYAVTDARGGAAGWNLTIAASQFSDGASNTLPTGSLLMAVPPPPTTNTLQNPLALPPTVQPTLSAIDGAAAAQKIASAAALPLAGAGMWTFAPLTGALTLSVPAAVTPGTYTSTITTTLSTGP